MNPQQFFTGSQEETENVGRELGRALEIPALILLEGPLGAGKTALARGIVEGFGCEDPTAVHSPTFSLINEYVCPKGIVYHVDLYRLETLQDLYSIGLDELVISDAVIIIEWAEKLLFAVDFTCRITIEITGDDSRTLRVWEKVPSES